MAIDLKKNKIFVEGIGDQVFIKDILSKLGISLTKEQFKSSIIDCKGYNNLSNHKDILLEIKAGQKRDGGKNLLIFDADFTGRESDHGYKNKIECLEARKLEFGIDFEIFLFPNNKNDGTLETLLESCINPKNSGILDCWHELENCIKNGSYTIPANKSKIYFYLECQYGISNAEKDKIKDPNRNFLEADKWNLDFNENPNLKELIQFLNKNLK